ncbi:MAG: hypothetical protein J7559_16330, partial [Cohnella sp.]|nr:hypothetical protein [Cohnella sp.]
MRLSHKSALIAALAVIVCGSSGMAMAAGQKTPLLNQRGQIMQTISTIAGNASASLGMPEGMAIGTDGALYVASPAEHNIIRLKDGGASAYAGSGNAIISGGGLWDGSKDAALFQSPSAIAVGPDGSLYV